MGFLSRLFGIDQLEENLVAKIDDLRTAIEQVGTNLAAAVTRVEAKIAELGEPDPDLTADIARLQDIGTQLNDLADDSTPDVVPPPDDGGDGTVPGDDGTVPGDGTTPVPDDGTATGDGTTTF